MKFTHPFRSARAASSRNIFKLRHYPRFEVRPSTRPSEGFPRKSNASMARKRSWSGSPKRQPAILTARCARLFSRRSGKTCFPRSSASIRHLVHLSGGCIRCCALPTPAITGACCRRARLRNQRFFSLSELNAASSLRIRLPQARLRPLPDHRAFVFGERSKHLHQRATYDR